MPKKLFFERESNYLQTKKAQTANVPDIEIVGLFLSCVLNVDI